MKTSALFTAAIFSASILSGPAAFAKPPTNWDGLAQVKSKRFDLVYLQPGADFRGYTKVLVEPTEVAFAKNWQRDYNRDHRSPSTRIADREVREAISEGVKAASDIFRDAWSKGGYEVVSAPGPDVLRVKTGIVNIAVTAPDRSMAVRSKVISREAGSATLVVEVKDSTTGALLGRAIDQGVAGGNFAELRDSSSNRADFRQMVENWASITVRSMTEIKSLPPTKP